MLSHCLHRVITRVRTGHKIRGLVTVGADEIAYCKGRKYATILYDLDRSRVIWVGRGLGRETIDRFFNEQLSYGQKQRIRWASCDRGRATTWAIQLHCSHATLVIDRTRGEGLERGACRPSGKGVAGARQGGRQAIKGLTWDARDAGAPSLKETVALLKRAAHLQPTHPPGLGSER